MKYLLSSESLQQLKELKCDFHAQLGDDLRDKIRNVIPELAKNNFFADRGIMWWILHNQLEVIGRMEVCKDLVRELISLASEQTETMEDVAAKLEAALDHLKQNLTHLTGELSVSEKHQDSFYVLDHALELSAVDIEGARYYYHKLIEPVLLVVETSDIQQALPRFSQSLQDRGIDKKFSESVGQTIDQLISTADTYYAEVSEFVDCEPQPIVLFYRFRRVESAGMRLLSTVILGETIMNTLRYILPNGTERSLK